MGHSPSFSFDAERGFFIVSFPGFESLSFQPAARLDGREVEGLVWQPTGDPALFQAHHQEGDWTLRQEETDLEGGVAFSLACQLAGEVRHVELSPLAFEPFTVAQVLTHGRAMGECATHLLPEEEAVAIKSTFFLSLTRANEVTLQLSHPLEQTSLSDFHGRVVGNGIHHLRASTVFDPAVGKAFKSDVVTLTASGQGLALLESWASLQAVDREPLPIPQTSGWNSWDYYRWTITEEEVMRNAEFIAADPVLSRHIDKIIIDDGWQYCHGEWEANSLFPSGMESVARNLRKLGFTPGLWFAPTLLDLHSRIAQLEPEMMAMAENGLPTQAFECMRRPAMLLDPTRERVKTWWREIFARYAGYGYRYFKLDFLQATLQAPRFHLPIPKGEIMAHILAPIREAVGPECRILGCNYQMQDAGRHVNDVRVSGDIHSDWTSVKHNVASIAARFWAHGRFWINDPDFALCRGDETADDPDLYKLKPLLVFVKPEEKEPHNFLSSIVDLNRREAEVLLSLVITSGGAMNLSDNLPRLNAIGLDLLRKAVQAEKGAAAIPLDLFRAKYPAFWAQKLGGGLHRLLLINWGEENVERTVDLGTLNFPTGKLTNFWTGEPVRLTAGSQLSVELHPHSCLLIEAQL